MIYHFFIVALGGALGAMARYGLRLALAGGAWPWGTFAANVLGGVAMGVLMAALPRGIDPRWTLFIGVGILGGFTTFSSFGAESFTMMQQGQVALALWYMLASVMTVMIALALGHLFVDRMMT